MGYETKEDRKELANDQNNVDLLFKIGMKLQPRV